MSAIRFIILGAALAGCAAPRSNATPMIVVSPGVAGRIALMDRYRLHDEDRKLMMARPHVWVEEVSDEGAPDGEGDTSADQPAGDAKPAE